MVAEISFVQVVSLQIFTVNVISIIVKAIIYHLLPARILRIDITIKADWGEKHLQSALAIPDRAVADSLLYRMP